MECPTCGFHNRTDARYCGMCGHRLTRPCPVCASANPTDYLFCIQCGARLAPGQASSHISERGETEPDDLAAVAPVAQQPAEIDVPLPQLKGERRVATIILADVQGSTDLLESVGSEAWVEIMNRMFQLLEIEIYRFGGSVDQFRGDGLVAFFGTDVAHEDDPERGVLAAMAMQRAVRSYARDLASQEGIDLSLRVGVNTGEVIVASVGNDQTYSENTAMGEAVALAARMEQAAEADTVLVSENTYRLVAQQFDWLSLGEIRVKGVSHPVQVHRPLTSRSQHDQSQGYGLAGPLIGRERAAETIIDCIEDLDEGLGGIVMLTGERGMGKSMLLQKVWRDFARRQALMAEVQHADGAASPPSDVAAGETQMGVTTALRLREIRGRARSYDQSQPYAMWQDLLRQWLGIHRDEPKEETRDRLRLQSEALWGRAMVEHYPDLGRFLGLPLEPEFAEQIKHLDAEGLRQHLFLALRSWLEELARQGPLIITFSDMHWADATSLELLKYCLPLCDYLDLLWLFVFRPDRRSKTWEFHHYVETEYPHRLESVALGPLTVDQSKALVEQMIGPGVFPEETETLIIQRAEGNPFFIQELVRSLITGGSLVRETTTAADGRKGELWHATQAVTTLSLPDSLQGLLTARVHRLSPTEQLVLQRAAVIGYSFWYDVLHALAPSPDDLRTHLTALQRAQIISERGRGPDLGVEYTFRSKLVRDVVYDSLLSSQCAAFHLQIADYIEGRFIVGEAAAAGPGQGRFYGTLAYHYQQANRPDKELDYTLRNADRAKDIYANAEAAQHYTHALTLLDQLEQEPSDGATADLAKIQRFQVLMQRHQVYYLMAEFGEMRRNAEALLPLARQLTRNGDPTWLIDALLHQPGVDDSDCREEVENGIQMAQEALELSRKIGDRRRELESLLAIISQCLALSDPAWRSLADEALELARETRNRTFEARILVDMGGIYAFSDEPERSMQCLEAAAALAMNEGLDDFLIQMSLLNLLGLEFERSGDYCRLLSEYQQERLHASREIGHRPMESQALQACGRITGIYLGDYATALDALQESRRIQAGSPRAVYSLFHIAQVHIAQADHESARETLAEIRRIGEPVLDRARASLRLVEAKLCNAEGAQSVTNGNSEDTARSLSRTLQLCRQVVELSTENPLVSQQYEMAAQCLATVAHLGLSQTLTDDPARAGHVKAALRAAERAHDIHQLFGFAQIIECVSEEVFLRYSQALAANQQYDLAGRFLRRAYDEMMRKHTLIPADSHFRRTYLEQIPLHREIRAAYASRVGSILTEAGATRQPFESAD